MIQHSHRIRVRYAECDRMGFVHHSVYALYFEEARTEALRELGIVYKDMEDSGVILPLRNLYLDFKRAARYDDLLRIESRIPVMPNVRCRVTYEIFNQDNELICTGSTELFFVDKQSLKPIGIPEDLKEKFQKHF